MIYYTVTLCGVKQYVETNSAQRLEKLYGIVLKHTEMILLYILFSQSVLLRKLWAIPVDVDKGLFWLIIYVASQENEIIRLKSSISDLHLPIIFMSVTYVQGMAEA